MTLNRVSYALDSTLESVNQAEETALQFAAESGFSEDEVQRISMAVREGVVNAVLHGNQYDPNKKVRISFEANATALVIRIADEGSGVDVENVPDPLAPENLLKTSGRGIFLIRAFMDEVHFKNLNPGTEITLVKHVSGAAADAKESSQ
ncbi:MAG TPA: ATP-binding protein [Terriglobales bacterium]|nr:ATP-binding protein [Terriglobales bacterium]